MFRGFRKKLKNLEEARNSENRFQVALQRINGSPHYEASGTEDAPYGFFAGRPIIGEKTQILGGIFVSAAPREAVVIDEKYGLLNRIYDEILLHYARQFGNMRPHEELFVPYILNFVRTKIRLNDEEAINMLNRENVAIDRKTALDFFVHKGIGTARHQVLLAAYLIERFKNRGVLDGNLEFETNMSLDEPLDTERLIYTNAEGRTIVFDPRTYEA